MATSGSYDFSMNRDEIVKAAMRKLGVLTRNENPHEEEVTIVALALNVMIKAWQAEGIGLWLNKTVTLFLQADAQSYQLGPTGDHATESYERTTLSAAAEEDDVAIEVTSATGFTATYNVGIELDDGSLQWTTVSSVTDTTITIGDALTDDAASGNTVYVYQTIAQRPLEVFNFRISNSNQNIININRVARQEYMQMTDKDTTGTINMAYYDPQTINGKLYTWPVTDTVRSVFEMSARKPIQDFDAATDDADIPVEWTRALIFNLTADVAPEFIDKIAPQRLVILKEYAIEAKEAAMRFDSENETSIFFRPDMQNTPSY